MSKRQYLVLTLLQVVILGAVVAVGAMSYLRTEDLQSRVATAQSYIHDVWFAVDPPFQPEGPTLRSDASTAASASQEAQLAAERAATSADAAEKAANEAWDIGISICEKVKCSP